MEIIDYGVCRLSVVSVRKDPANTSEMVTQLLFGEHYEVLELRDSRDWCRIRIDFDQYEGWIDVRQHHSVSREYFDYINRAEFKITTDITSSILYHKSPQIILMGSMIPISSSELFKMEEQFAFNGEAKNVGQKREFEFLKTMALKYLNAPYQWGGKGPFGIDCSGYKLSRDARQQAIQGKLLKNDEPFKPGDLAFFKNTTGEIGHVGILLEGDRIVHASGRVRIDHFIEEGILNSETKIYTHQLTCIRRILPEAG
jgi:hypothetical protein